MDTDACECSVPSLFIFIVKSAQNVKSNAAVWLLALQDNAVNINIIRKFYLKQGNNKLKPNVDFGCI